MYLYPPHAIPSDPIPGVAIMLDSVERSLHHTLRRAAVALADMTREPAPDAWASDSPDALHVAVKRERELVASDHGWTPTSSDINLHDMSVPDGFDIPGSSIHVVNAVALQPPLTPDSNAADLLDMMRHRVGRVVDALAAASIPERLAPRDLVGLTRQRLDAVSAAVSSRLDGAVRVAAIAPTDLHPLRAFEVGPHGRSLVGEDLLTDAERAAWSVGLRPILAVQDHTNMTQGTAMSIRPPSASHDLRASSVATLRALASLPPI